ncbi:MAG: FAD-dependent monooxygenase [Thermoanaerobaculia bacterium]
MHATIIGAGIGGFTAAIALRQEGIESDIYERAAEIRGAGAGVTLWPNAIRVLRRLGLADAIIARGQKIERARLRTTDGRVLARSAPGEIERTFGEPTIAIHRADLHEILFAAVPRTSLHLGHSCTSVAASKGEVTFEDGTRVTDDLVIGADGIHSAVRHAVRPDLTIRDSGYVAWRGVAEAPELVEEGSSESWGCGERFGIVAIDANRIYWFATANLPSGRTPSADESRSELLRRFSSWHAPVRELIERTPSDAILYNDIQDLPPHRGWSSGRTVLLGDAIHATTPNLGQGACMAIESALVLARSLARESALSQALRKYEDARFPRTRWITDQSRKFGRIAQSASPFGCAVRNAVLRIVPDAMTRRVMFRAAAFEP